jgi:hypothetical protein
VGFAVGAFVETFMRNYQGVPKAEEIYNKNVSLKYNKNFPFKLSCNANSLFDLIRVSAGKPMVDNQCSLSYLNARRNSSLKVLEPYLIKFEDKPPKGGLITWGGSGVNHVAYISDVSKDGNTITTLHSGWMYPSWTYPVNGGYKPAERIYHRDLSNGTYGYKGKYLGYLQNPAIIDDDTGTTSTIQKPTISTVTQPTSTTINVVGDRNSDSSYIRHTKLFYKWGPTVSPTDYDGYDDTYDVKFSVIITKPRETTQISILPVHILNDGSMIEGTIITKPLQKSYPCVQIVNSNKELVNSIPHLYVDGEWKEVVPTVRDRSGWYELYNTDKERVK